MDSSSRLQESESSDAESDNAPLLKTNRNKKSKRAERTPLLASNHGEGSSQTASGIEPAAAIRGRAGTETSDDDTVCFYNERYGSVSGGYAGVLVEAHRAMNHGIFPERIPQGSSGSYFVKNLRGVRVIV
uniref:SH2 domain-containing protein n=1 Tax=Panagrellus redivivus TaxID=6233 RepID=A0A7E4VG11_PANRE